METQEMAIGVAGPAVEEREWELALLGPGRPSEYDATVTPVRAEWCAAQGQSLAQIAAELGVDRRTVVRWRARYATFRDAIDAGWAQVNDEVEGRLLKLALGYTYVDEEVRFVGGQETKVVRTRTQHPNIRAIALWLANHRGG